MDRLHRCNRYHHQIGVVVAVVTWWGETQRLWIVDRREFHGGIEPGAQESAWDGLAQWLGTFDHPVTLAIDIGYRQTDVLRSARREEERMRRALSLSVVALAPLGAEAVPDGHRSFRDDLRSGGHGPDMVVIPAGRFRMGCDRGEPGCLRHRTPSRVVVFAAPFAMSKYEITFDDYDRYLSAKGGGRDGEAHDQGWGRGRRPVINVTRKQAVAYADWLTAQTGGRYRLPSEAEWEYAARAGTTTEWPWGDELVPGRANCKDCGSRWDNERTAPVGSFPPNPWGLHDMQGNVYEMLLDCMRLTYKDAPTDGSAQEIDWRSETDWRGNCKWYAVRSGAWLHPSDWTRSSARVSTRTKRYAAIMGIRLVRELDAAQGSPPG